MSCGVALAVSLLLSDPNVALAASQPSPAAGAPVSVAAEPLLVLKTVVDHYPIVGRSSALRSLVGSWQTSGAADQTGFLSGPAFAGFKAQAAELAGLDMQGHLILKERGTDGDLKCILRGIAEDIPVKVAAFEAAVDPAERRVALDELAYLFDDNAAVITAPPQPEV